MAEENDKDLLAKARKRFDACVSANSSNRALQLEDLRFFAASPDNGWQWPSAVKSARESDPNGPRPCLTINKLPQHVRQVTNEQRQNMPAVKVLPVDSKSDPEVAKVMNGIIRHIEYHSDAETAYDIACESQVVTGEGYWRILTDYCDEKSFDQDILVAPIRNHEAAYLEPYCDSVGSDASYGFITQDFTEDEFAEKFPTAQPVNWTQVGNDADFSNWYLAGSKTIRVAEYFYKEITERKLLAFSTGDLLFEDEIAPEILPTLGAPVKTRRVMSERVKWCKLTGAEVLEKNDWAGKYIPIIRVVGNEVEVEGEIYYYGLVRPSKDAQRMYNYWSSQEAELLALAPKAPFIGAVGQFENYEQKWKTANQINYAYLEYNPVIEGGVAAPPPQRVAPPMPSAGILQAKMGAADDIKGTTAQYDASLGARSNETSGKAIMARERQGDTANFHYIDNLSRSMRYAGRQLVDLIPKIYDSRRIARIVQEGGDTDQVIIDPAQQEAVLAIGEGVKSYNLSVGTYDVMVTVGPSYASKRQENAEMMGKILQTTPQLWPIAGDLLVREMDWPGADKFADRLKFLHPPALQQAEQAKEKGGQPMPPQAIAAVQQAQMAMQAVQQKAQELAEVEKKLQGEATKTAVDKAALEEARTQLQAEKRVLDADYARIKAELKAWEAQKDADIATQNASITHDQAKLAEQHAGLILQSADQHMKNAGEMMEKVNELVAPTQTGSLSVVENLCMSIDELKKLMMAPRSKKSKVIENPDGSFSMESVETMQ